jgi:hypothetical protein
MKLPPWLLLFPVLFFGPKPVPGEWLEAVAARAPSAGQARIVPRPAALPAVAKRLPANSAPERVSP